MIVVRTYTEKFGEFSGLTSAVDFESLKKRLRLYFKNVGQVKARLFAGEKISIPYTILQRNRRVRDIRVSDERRVNKI